jgi:acyl-coenzyme A synthetase/AMP-(fatty) acid ligase
MSSADGGLPLAAVHAAPSRTALVCDDGRFTYAALDAERERIRLALAASGAQQVLLHVEETLAGYAALLAVADAGLPTVLLPPAPTAAVSDAVDKALGADAALIGGQVTPTAQAAHRRLEAGSVVIVTSGTTGTPKVVGHTWATLARAVRTRGSLDGSVWQLAYPYHLYAGLQVTLHALLNAATLVMAPGSRDADATLERMADERVGFISATPSFFRRLLLFGSHAAVQRVPLEQVTLGGERVTQDVLDSLHAAFPSARLVHIYATSELGRCFAVDDGREGFPAALLRTGTPDGVGLRVQDGELHVRPVNGMRGYLHVHAARSADSWIGTGDLVDVDGDRVRFRGRRHDLINVGGSKVNPATVEDVVRACPHVLDARVYGKRNALVGELVAADVVGDGALDEAQLSEGVKQHCAARLLPAERPRVVRVVPRIQVSEAGKVVRRTA